MDPSTKAELDSITAELNSIINRLETSSHDIKIDFENIGNDRCSQAVADVADQCKRARRSLNTID